MRGLLKPNAWVLPTAAGWVFLLMVIALTLAAINYGNNVLYALAFLLAAGGTGNAWGAWRALSGLTAGAPRLAAGFAGEALACELRVADGGVRARHALYLMHGRRAGEPVSVARGESAALELAMPARRRGPLRIDGLVLASDFPFGLFRACRRIRGAAAALVYPAPEAADAARHAEWRNAARVRAETDTYSHCRDYVPGDHPARIDWRAFARSDTLSVKVFDGGQGGAAVWLDWRDTGCAKPADLSEATLSRLCRWVLDAHAHELCYGLRLPGREIAPASGAAQRERCLEALARHELTPRADAPRARRWWLPRAETA